MEQSEAARRRVDQYNGKQEKVKKTNDNRQKTTQKTKH